MAGCAEEQVGGRIARASALIDVRRFDDAAVELRQALASDPDRLDARCLLALCLFKLGQLDAALEAAESAAARHPNTEWPHRLRSIILAEKGKKRQALQAAREAARIDPDSPAALHTLGLALLASGKNGEAAQLASRLLSIAPEMTAVHVFAGNIAMAEKRYADAEQAYAAALRLDSQNQIALNNLAAARMGQGKARESLGLLENAVRANPEDELSRQNLELGTQKYLYGPFTRVLRRARFWPLLLILATPAARQWLEPTVAVLFLGLLGWGTLVWWKRRRTLSPAARAYYASRRRQRMREMALREGKRWGIIFGSLFAFCAFLALALHFHAIG